MIFACLYGASADLVDALPEIAAAFSPSFEQTAPDTVVFRIDGLRRIHGSPRQIAEAIAKHAGASINIAIAETADAAIIAARNFPGVTVAPNLNDLDVSTLPLTEEMAQVLETWGIYTFEQLAQLPETGLAERFGSAGVYLQRLARNAIQRPLKIFQPETTYEDRIQLDHPVSLLEPLLFLIARLLNDQCARLLSNAMAANEVTIRLELENRAEHTRTLRLPVPMRDSKSLLKLLQMDLEAHPPTAPTIAITLTLKPVHPRTVQTGIFLPITPAPDKLELTLARIRGIVGENNVGIPQLLNTHHPNPFRLVAAQPAVSSHQPLITSKQGFRFFRPPLPATVALDCNRPLHIHASGIHGDSGIHGKVLNAAGPWRSSGDWWSTSVWNRDEWDIALSNGSLYRIYSDPHWFIEGSYD
jgi:protein ImuB